MLNAVLGIGCGKKIELFAVFRPELIAPQPNCPRELLPHVHRLPFSSIAMQCPPDAVYPAAVLILIRLILTLKNTCPALNCPSPPPIVGAVLLYTAVLVPPTRTGKLRLVVEPSPSCPVPLLPHAYTSPLFIKTKLRS